MQQNCGLLTGSEAGGKSNGFYWHIVVDFHQYCKTFSKIMTYQAEMLIDLVTENYNNSELILTF